MWDNSKSPFQNAWDGLTTGLSAIGKNIGNAWNNITGRTQMAKFNANEAAKQRAFEKMMADTSLQRAVNDAKLAGINPASIDFSAQGGFTPSGNSATAPSFGSDFGQFITGVARSALSIALFRNLSKAPLNANTATQAAKVGTAAAAANNSVSNAVARQIRLDRLRSNRYSLGGHVGFRSGSDLSRFKI